MHGLPDDALQLEPRNRQRFPTYDVGCLACISHDINLSARPQLRLPLSQSHLRRTSSLLFMIRHTILEAIYSYLWSGTADVTIPD